MRGVNPKRKKEKKTSSSQKHVRHESKIIDLPNLDTEIQSLIISKLIWGISTPTPSLRPPSGKTDENGQQAPTKNGLGSSDSTISSMCHAGVRGLLITMYLDVYILQIFVYQKRL